MVQLEDKKKTTLSRRDFDVIIIGSGAGGLTAAVALSNAGKRVLVVEQHYMAGGWCHSFVLDKKHRFSPGVHYIGELAEGQMLRRIYQGLGISRDLEFCQLNTDGFDHVTVGNERFDYPTGAEAFQRRLIERFPHERAGIESVLRTVRQVTDEVGMLPNLSTGWRRLLLPIKARHLLFQGMQTWGSVVNRQISDPLLRAILAAQCGDHGTAPADVPFAMHAAVMAHYFKGAYYPRGGAHRIPRAYVRQLKRTGGQLLLATAVKSIVIDKGRAVGVILDDGQEVSAPVVVSNADPDMTLRRLVGEQHLSWWMRRKLKRTDYGVTAVSLFLATGMDLGGMGFDSGNYWWYRHHDIDAMYRNLRVPEEMFDACFVTVTTLKDPSKFKGDHTLEVFGMLPYQPFARWANQPCEGRDADYVAFKQQLAKKMLRSAEHVIPGLSENLTFMEVGTPLSNEHYCASHRGNLYGTAKIRSQMGPFSFPTRTEIPGLYMVGAATLGHGVMGVTMSGLVGAAQILRCPLRELFTENQPAPAIYPSDHPELWLGKLQQRRNAPADAEHAASS